MANATIPFQGSVALPMPPPRPPGPTGPLPVLDEIEWLRAAVESGQRTIKYLLDNYKNLLAKAEAEGIVITPGATPTFGPPQTFAIGAIIAPGEWVVTAAGSISLTPTLGQVVDIPTQGAASAQTVITMMPVT